MTGSQRFIIIIATTTGTFTTAWMLGVTEGYIGALLAGVLLLIVVATFAEPPAPSED